MEHAEDYEIVRTEEDVLVFVIKSRQTDVENPRLIYDGGRHATLYRRPDDVLLLDYLNDDVLENLRKSEIVIVAEADFGSEKIVRDYEVHVKQVKKNPFCDNLK